MSVLLEAKGLSFAYGGQARLLNDIDFALEAGEIVGITGDSGSGKTTFLNCLAGIIPHIYGGDVSGAVLLKGADISKMKLHEIAVKVGVLFQNPDTQLFSGAVLDDIVFGPENLCLPWEEIDGRLKSVLDVVDIGKKLMENPKTLSGGEAQLAALSATLALDPEILLFDEAMSQLDKSGTAAVTALALDLKSRGKGVIMIEHDARLLKIADRVLWLDSGKLGVKYFD